MLKLISSLSLLILLTLGQSHPGHAYTTPLFWGIAYGPFRAFESPSPSAMQPTDREIKADMPQLKLLGSTIRTYGCSGASGDIPAIASQYGMNTWVGASIDGNEAVDDAEIKTLIKTAKEPGVKVVIVGNEVLGRYAEHHGKNDLGLPLPKLLKYIDLVRSSVPPSIKVAYADAIDPLHDNSRALATHVDLVIANIHPYWASQDEANAATFVYSAYRQLTKDYQRLPVVIGEVGWPSDGLKLGKAVPSLANEKHFVVSLRTMLVAHPDIKCFYFEAFDEPYKQEGNLNIGPHWGLYTTSGRPKFQLTDNVLDENTSRATDDGVVMLNGLLATGLGMGVNTSKGQTSWVSNLDGQMTMNYPAGQDWGAVFITVGDPGDSPRITRDYSKFKTMVLELKGETGNEQVNIGVKTEADPDTGKEPKFNVTNLSTPWKEYRIPMTAFTDSAPEGTARLNHLYVVCEFVFGRSNSVETIYCKNIHFER
jgi:exo-beta-1,3-glucanase (GH17 family)